MNLKKIISLALMFILAGIYLNIHAADSSSDFKILRTISAEQAFKLVIDNKMNMVFILEFFLCVNIIKINST